MKPGGGPDPLRYLEPDQLALLSRRACVGLWALRVLVLVLGAMVVFTFISQLSPGR